MSSLLYELGEQNSLLTCQLSTICEELKHLKIDDDKTDIKPSAPFLDDTKQSVSKPKTNDEDDQENKVKEKNEEMENGEIYSCAECQESFPTISKGRLKKKTLHIL